MAVACNDTFSTGGTVTTVDSPQPAFGVGDRVRVKADNHDGNPRTPRYIRGKAGVVGELHGVIYNPQDHRGLYPYLYSVVFHVRDVFGTATADRLSVDLHEDWLERA
jgi:nitrile hydratase